MIKRMLLGLLLCVLLVFINKDWAVYGSKFLGAIAGVYCFSFLINFLLKKIRIVDTTATRSFIVLLVFLTSIIFNSYNLNKVQALPSEIIDGIIFYILGLYFTLSLFALRLTTRQFLLVSVYVGIIWWAIDSALALINQLIGASVEVVPFITLISTLLSFSAVVYLFYFEKLPFSNSVWGKSKKDNNQTVGNVYLLAGLILPFVIKMSLDSVLGLFLGTHKI